MAPRYRDVIGDELCSWRHGANGRNHKGQASSQRIARSDFSILYSFKNGPDGANPVSGLVRDAAGNLYGTTFQSGDANCYCGMVFKLDKAEKEIVLHSFVAARTECFPRQV